MIYPISKEYTQELEYGTVAIENIVHFSDTLLRITGWYRYNGLTTMNTQKERKDKLSELLGFKPQYHVTYEYRNAVWGIIVDGLDCILIYLSKRGLSINVDPDMSENRALEILRELSVILNCES